MDGLPTMTTQTFIGILVAITGNILISLALNLQKVAHKRVETRKKALNNGKQRSHLEDSGYNHLQESRVSEGPSLDEHDEDRELFDARRAQLDVFSDSPSETQPLIAFPESGATPRNYSTCASPGHSTITTPSETKSGPLTTRLFSKNVASGPHDNMSAEQGLLPTPKGLDIEPETDYQISKEGNESDYLKSRLWWLGFLLMNVGELGNFISYAFAPASVVAPLGTFALIANCFFAPVLLGEFFRKLDLLGVVIAIIGAVTVVLASNASDTRLGPEALLRAISQTSFIVYSSIYVAGIILLATLSEGSIGRTWVFVDIGLCALFGGFTVLSTKALSTLITLEWIDIFTEWITYPLIAVLVFTGVGQIRYLNRALMRFDSKVVIPIQFVLFTLSAIIGSAILYGDFQKANFHEIITFFYGCVATFVGVFIIAWAPNHSESDPDYLNESGDETPSANGDPSQTSPGGYRHGLARRKRVIPVLPAEVTDTPAPRRDRSSLSVIGISPAQHLLLVHDLPREPLIFQHNGEGVDIERDAQTPDSYHRRRTMSWYGNGERSGHGTRESSIVGRLRNGVGRVGSLDGQQNNAAMKLIYTSNFTLCTNQQNSSRRLTGFLFYDGRPRHVNSTLYLISSSSTSRRAVWHLQKLADHLLPFHNSNLILLRRVLFICASSFSLDIRFFPLNSFGTVKPVDFLSYNFWVIGGELLRKIQELHNMHGPVVRIAPNELHFNDYRAYSKIYGVGSGFTKEPGFYSCFGASNSTFGAIDPNVSKARRGVMNPFFSRHATLKLESMIQKKVDKLVSRLLERNDEPSNMFLAFRSTTLDIITAYMFGYCIDALDHPDFCSPLLLDIQAALPILWVIKAFPWLVPAIALIPAWLGGTLYNQYRAFGAIRQHVNIWLSHIEREAEKSDELRGFTICHRLLHPSVIHYYDLQSTQYLLDEALSLLQAGSDTVGNTCTVGTFYVLNDKLVLSNLFEELQSIWPDQDETAELATLQTLPYLTAVIKEALRLSHGFVTPLPRVVGPLGAKIADWQVPAHTIVGMSVTCLHLNSTLFPKPDKFTPDRWLEPRSDGLNQYLVPFSKGPRMCLGINIAWAELYLIFGHIFRRVEMEMVDTSLDDFCKFKDYFVPIHQGRQLHIRSKQALQ